jgi:Holliday junction resolvase
MTQYSRGADFERSTWKDLQKHGWFVIRSAGSRGVIDLMAVAPGPEVLFIQCKRDGRLSIEDRRDLYNLALAFHATPILAYRDDDKQLKYSEIQGDAYVDWHPSDEATLPPASGESEAA